MCCYYVLHFAFMMLYQPYQLVIVDEYCLTILTEILDFVCILIHPDSRLQTLAFSLHALLQTSLSVTQVTSWLICWVWSSLEVMKQAGTCCPTLLNTSGHIFTSLIINIKWSRFGVFNIICLFTFFERQ